MSKPSFNIVKKNVPKNFMTDTYHDLLMMRWSYTLIGFFLVFILCNSIFATLYWFDVDGLINVEGSWLGCFYFSVETLATIGYGHVTPLSHYAHWLVTIEAAMGTIITAIMAGFFFAKFARPSSKVEFSNKALISNFEGKPTFIFRMVNVRDNQLLDSVIEANVFKPIITKENESIRKFLNLKLVRSKIPIFSLSITIMHIIDDESPLKELLTPDGVSDLTEIFITSIGVDSTFGQTVHATQLYKKADIHLNRYFQDMLTVAPDGTRVVDYKVFNDLKPL